VTIKCKGGADRNSAIGTAFAVDDSKDRSFADPATRKREKTSSGANDLRRIGT
jgi:hypothetical protein